MRDVDGLAPLLPYGFQRELTVTILHGVTPMGSDVPESWSLDFDLDNDPKVTGQLRIVHRSVYGESWAPKGRMGMLSPFRATLLLTEKISAGNYERQVQLGLFDVVAIPYAEDFTSVTNARWKPWTSTEGDVFPVDDELPADDAFPGSVVYGGGGFTGGVEKVVATVIDLEVESLDGRVLRGNFRRPRTSLTSALDEWRTIGMLPVAVSGDAAIPATTWPAEDGSRLDAVQHCARALGGVPFVDSYGRWALTGDLTPTVTLVLGENGTVVDLSSRFDLAGFANVIVGDYEDGIHEEWVARGALSPDTLGFEVVKYHTSPTVVTRAQARAAVAEQGYLATSREVDVEVTCVYNPMVELGDHVVVEGADVSGVAVRISMSDAATMTVVVRSRRPL